MSPVTHFLAGWMVASSARLHRRERALVTLAGVAPDIDGLGIIPEYLTRHSIHPLLWFSDYHHSLHTLWFALVVSVMCYGIAGPRSRNRAGSALLPRRWTTALLAFLSFHLHLLCDLIGARGPDGYPWPIPYLKPLSSALQLSWSGQWALNGWQNIAITVVLLAATLIIARNRGLSPIEIFSPRADRAFVAVLRRRFPLKSKSAVSGCTNS